MRRESYPIFGEVYVPSDSIMKQAKVHILLGVFNGMPYLPKQLNSIAAQQHSNWHLWASDDGSTDGSQTCLRYFASQHPDRVTITSGPKADATANFLHMLTNPDRPDGYIAFCDQDDVWYPDKLARALNTLQRATHPVSLYCSRTNVGSDPSSHLQPSPLWQRPFGFRNALIQSVGGANSMVLSPKAAIMVRRAAQGPPPAFHDWWSYQLVTAAGGEILYDVKPSLFYRQHARNIIGCNRGLAARFSRLNAIQRGAFRFWMDQNLVALDYMRAQFGTEARDVLDQFNTLRKQRGARAIKTWTQMGLYRQSRHETRLLALASTIGKI